MSILIFIIKSIILPPGIFIVALLLALVCWRNHRRFSFLMVLLAAVFLYLFSMPLFSVWLAKPLQENIVLKKVDLKRLPQAIVVLGAGRYSNAPEYGKDVASEKELVRLRYAKFLYRQTHLPILLSGGSVFGERQKEAMLMKMVMENDFGVPIKWTENQSRNSWENAKFSSAILKKAGITSIYLVTDAVHMKRSIWVFKHFGLTVVAAPTDFQTLPFHQLFLNYFPIMKRFKMTTNSIHEYIGLVAYKFFQYL